MNRLSILINRTTAGQLRHMKVCQGRSYTESVRKAVALWWALKGQRAVIRNGGTERELKIIDDR